MTILVILYFVSNTEKSSTEEGSQQSSTEVIQRTIMEEQRVVVRDDSHISSPIMNLFKNRQFVMNEKQYGVMEMLKTPQLISTGNWLEADTPGSTLNSFNVPGVLSLVPNFHKSVLEIYAYFKPTLVFRFQINSTKFHQGRLICWYDPFQQYATTMDTTNSSKFINRYSMTMQPHVQLDCSINNIGELEIPFEHVQSFLTTNSPDPLDLMGVVYISVLNTLASSTGSSPNLTINTLVYCKDIALNVPIYPHAPLIPSLVAQGIFDIFEAEFWENTWSVIKNGADSVYNIITGNYSGAAKSAGATLSSLSEVLSVYNLDKPADMLIGTDRKSVV